MKVIRFLAAATCLILLWQIYFYPRKLEFNSTVIIEPHFLENLSYKFGSDKSKDDHKYTDMYQMLFDKSRLDILNVTEIGSNAGQSIQAWYFYFPNAHIFTYDVIPTDSMRKIAEIHSDRLHYQILDLVKDYDKAALVDESMDVVIEDASHWPSQQRALLKTCFRLVKPGGYYIIEDIWYTKSEGRDWQTNISALGTEIQTILLENDVVFVDTHVGHRDWKSWKNQHSAKYITDHLHHNSYLLIVRKRMHPLSPHIKMNAGSVAMKAEKVIF